MFLEMGRKKNTFLNSGIQNNLFFSVLFELLLFNLKKLLKKKLLNRTVTGY